MNEAEAKARLYDIEKRLQELFSVVRKASTGIKEAMLENTCITSPDFEVYNAGLLFDKVSLIAKQGQRAMDEIKRLSAEKESIEQYLKILNGGV